MAEKIKKYCLIPALILFIIAFALIYNIFKQNYHFFSIKYLSTIVEPVTVNLILDKKIENANIGICFNYNCNTAQPTQFYNTYFAVYNDKYYLNSAHIELPPNVKIEDIDSIYIYSGNQNYHYNKSEIKTFNYETNNLGQSRIKLPKINNYGGTLNHYCVLFLSLFYHANFFIIPYILIFAGFLILYFFKNIKLSRKLIIPVILIAVALRFNHLTYTPLWTDELYTKFVALDSFKSLFSDPGNPPLFYILEFIFTKIFSSSILALRFLPFVFGSLAVYVIWLLFKDISVKFAFFACFMAGINSILIGTCQDARGYSLDVLISISAIYFLFGCIKNPNNKNIILNGILTALLVNTNYYLILIAMGNTLWGGFFVKENKLKFLISDFVGALTALPYLLISFSSALEGDFNSYIKPVLSENFADIVLDYFATYSNLIIFSLAVTVVLILYFIPKIKNKNIYYPYLCFILAFTLIGAIMISVCVKPMIERGNICAIYGIFFLLIVSTVYPLIDTNKIAKVLVLLYSIPLTFMFINMTYPELYRNLDDFKNYADFVTSDAPKYHAKNYDVHAVWLENMEYMEEYKELKKLDYINWHVIKLSYFEFYNHKQNPEYLSKNSNVVIYLPQYNTDIENLRFYNPDFYINNTNYLPIGKLVYGKK